MRNYVENELQVTFILKLNTFIIVNCFPSHHQFASETKQTCVCEHKLLLFPKTFPDHATIVNGCIIINY